MNQRPLSLLMFSNATVRGGAEEHTLQLLRGLNRRFFRPYLACPAELIDKYAEDIPADVRTLRVTVDALSHFRAARQLAKALRNWKIDILHSHMFRASLFASPVAKLCGVPLVIETPHVRELWRQGWLKSKYIVDRMAGWFVDQYIAVSQANARYLIEQKKLPAAKIRVIHNSCPLERFDPAHPVPLGLRASLGFNEADPVLVVVARLEPQKGHRVLLDAMPLVRREFPNVRLVCVGDGVLREDLVRKMQQLGIQEAVRFVGYQNNPPDWLALADLCVLPSYYEGLPLVAIESLAAGRPLVATDVDGTPEIVLDGTAGLLVPPGNAQRLAGAICELLRDPERRRLMAEAGRKHVLKAFSMEKFLRETERLYLDVWNRHQGVVLMQQTRQAEEAANQL